MKKSDLKLIIRKIVREEVAMAIQEVITELKTPAQTKLKSKKKIVEKKSFTNNSVLNDVLNETAINDEWKTLGGGTFDSSKMNEVLSSQYQNTMNGSTQPAVSPNDPMAQFLNKDYSAVLQKSIEKTKQKNGG